jgi:hypothetical protein
MSKYNLSSVYAERKRLNVPKNSIDALETLRARRDTDGLTRDSQPTAQRDGICDFGSAERARTVRDRLDSSLIRSPS